MSNIVENLRKILTARYGRDVRQSIHDAIHDCYEDGRAGATDIVAREMIADVEAQIAPATTSKAGLVKPDGETITVDEDGTIHGSEGGASTWSEVAEKPFNSIGNTLKVAGGVLDAKVDEQEITDLKMLGWTVPTECPIQNYTDNDGIYHQRVDRVDMGDLDWLYIPSETRFITASLINDIEKAYEPSNVYTSKYTSNKAPVEGIEIDKTICPYVNGGLFLNDFSFTDGTALKNANKGNYLYYKLATEITIPIDGNEATTNQMLSDEWTSGKTYALGDFAIYKNKLWKSKVANNLGNTPAEGSYWTATNVGSELNKDIIQTYSEVEITTGQAETFISRMRTAMGKTRNNVYMIAIQGYENSMVNAVCIFCGGAGTYLEVLSTNAVTVTATATGLNLSTSIAGLTKWTIKGILLC